MSENRRITPGLKWLRGGERKEGARLYVHFCSSQTEAVSWPMLPCLLPSPSSGRWAILRGVGSPLADK